MHTDWVALREFGLGGEAAGTRSICIIIIGGKPPHSTTRH